MSLELDHVFCFCEPTLSEAKALEASGFTVDHGRKHHGQGTANRCVVFQSNYLELIYLDSEIEARTNPVQLHLRADWNNTNRSPFGIALRGEIPPEDRSMFWSYIPPYNTSRVIMMHRFNEQRPEFPLLFVMPTSPESMSAGVRFKGFVPHKIGATEINEVIVHAPFAEWPLSTQVKGLNFRTGPKHQMEVRINGTRPMDLRLNELLSVMST